MTNRQILALLFSAAIVACEANPIAPDPVVTIQLTVPRSTLIVGDTLRVSALAIKAGNTPDSATAILWSSSDTAVAKIDQTGRVIARTAGVSRISASVGNIGASESITVVANAGLFTCAQPGILHRDVELNATWRAKDGPHRLMNAVTVDTLVIEPGTLVCAAPGAGLTVRKLIANGTSALPIRFLASDGVSVWNGITNAGQSGSNIVGGIVEMSHVFLELGNVSTGFVNTTVLDSHVRKANLLCTCVISRTVVDTGNVMIGSTGGGTFEETVIREGTLTLAYYKNFGTHTITVNGGRIEGSPGIALTIGSIFAPGAPQLDVVKTLRITGSRGGVADMPVALFTKLWPTRAAQDSLLGNPDGTLNLWGVSAFNGSGPLDAGDVSVRRELPWNVRAYLGSVSVASATFDSGSTLSLAGSNFNVIGKMNALGTADSPITIRQSTTNCSGGAIGACSLRVLGTAASTLSHITFRHVALAVADQNRTQLDHIDSDEWILLQSAGSTITDSEVHDTPSNTFPGLPMAGLTLAADSVRAQRVIVRATHAGAGVVIRGSFVQMLACDITDNVGDGVQVTAGAGIELHDCNFDRNGGLAVNNTAPAMVNAQRNWWGDPAGPLGPNGDGVSSNVDFSNFLVSRRNP